MISHQEILPLGEPGSRPDPEADSRVVTHLVRRQESPAPKPTDHLIPKPHDGGELARLTAQPVLVQEGVTAVLDHDLGQWAVEVMGPGAEA